MHVLSYDLQSNQRFTMKLVTWQAIRLSIRVAVSLITSNSKDQRVTVIAPLNLRHIVAKPNVPLVSPAPLSNKTGSQYCSHYYLMAEVSIVAVLIGRTLSQAS